MTTPQRKFAGLAYWRLAKVEAGWADLATETVQPLVELGRVTVKTATLKDGSEELILDFPEGQFSMRVKNGEGRGVVRDTPSALPVVLCLMAMRRKVNSLSLVDDNQGEFPVRVTQQLPLFADNWSIAIELAELLGLVPSKRFLENEGAITLLMF